jgi:ribonuclease HII
VTLKKLKAYFATTSALPQAELEKWKEDPRESVQRLVSSYEQQQKNLAAEKKRIEKLWSLEKNLQRQGVKLIAGIDEAGRGPLAGPVVAAAVVMPVGFMLPGLNDSKKLTAKKRATLQTTIRQHAISLGVGLVEADLIDELNIWEATCLAMQKAISALTINPEHLLIDAMPLPKVAIPQTNLIKGDQRSASIAAASIIAKTTRDKYMEKLANKYPAYAFEKHKGYGTLLHMKILAEIGPSPIHRQSFKPVSALLNNAK